MGAWGDGRRVAVVLATQSFGPSRLCVVYCSLLACLVLFVWKAFVVGWVWKRPAGAGGRGSERKALQFVCCGVWFVLHTVLFLLWAGCMALSFGPGSYNIWVAPTCLQPNIYNIWLGPTCVQPIIYGIWVGPTCFQPII